MAPIQKKLFGLAGFAVGRLAPSTGCAANRY
jgi:hypothetical protein